MLVSEATSPVFGYSVKNKEEREFEVDSFSTTALVFYISFGQVKIIIVRIGSMVKSRPGDVDKGLTRKLEKTYIK